VFSKLSLSVATRRALDRLGADLRRVFGERFIALVAYGTNASVAFTASVRPDDLEAFGPLVTSWQHDGVAVPLIITPEEFHRSLDAFPLEYQAILDRHVVITGEPPFAGAVVRPDDLRRACEAQARAHLIHLRQGWLQAAAHEPDLIELIVRSAGPFTTLIANVARLHGAPHETDEQLAVFAETTIGMPADLVKVILDLDEHPEHGTSMLPRLGEYLKATERLWDFVDAWRSA
jgi:hypothetical protein